MKLCLIKQKITFPQAVGKVNIPPETEDYIFRSLEEIFQGDFADKSVETFSDHVVGGTINHDSMSSPGDTGSKDPNRPERKF